MAVTFNRNLEYAAIGVGLGGGGDVSYVGGLFGNNSAVSIFSGSQPTAAAIVANWGIYNSTNPVFLAHYDNCRWTEAVARTANFCTITTFHAAVPAANTGTAGWAIIWPTNPVMSDMTALLPSNYFLVCAVSTLPGSGIIKFDPDLNFTQGINKSIADAAIAATMP